jgi:glutathione reductase (NADPH)
VARENGRYRVRYGQDGQESLVADVVVNCAGRVPNIGQLDLEAAGVEAGPKGITVKPTMQSASNPKVWAVGDVADTKFELTPVAVLEAKVASTNALDPDANEQADYTGIPTVCFTLPPIAACGLTTEEAEEQGIPHKTFTHELSNMFSWERIGAKYGRSKVLVDEKEERILGAHLLGNNAEEMINLFALAIRQGITLDELKATYWAYPTCGYYMSYLIRE